MKYFFCFAVVALCALAFNSCGSSRLPNDYQAFLAHQQEIGRGEETPEWETVQPKRKKRELDECLVMANEESDAFRSYGVGVSYRENIALDNAESDAVSRMVQQIETAVEGARKRYTGSAGKNLSTADEERIQAMIMQFIKGTVSYRVIKTSMYDLSDGTIQCYVCIEQRVSKDEAAKDLANVLSDSGVLGIEENSDRFAESIKEDMERYRQERAESDMQ